ncbi:MAG: L-seryl-tRNA(Sec) selenium transferase [Halieaceae bacterium]|nr:L-seryl-tRNA(Sec) selenium transferase [Halieaceae bacterium]
MSTSESLPEANPHRQVPSVDAVLQNAAREVATWGQPQVVEIVRQILAEVRQQISVGQVPELDMENICSRLGQILSERNAPRLLPVINLTGTVLHTNLGRASLPREALDAVAMAASSPTNLEFDLHSGVRGDRESHIEDLICELTGAEAATAVNNNAAAVLLVLNTLAMNAQVPVSRGELVEIGGSFRIPEVMQRANCSLVEVGATNRTHLKDYQSALNDNTALLLKVHTSNYRIEGFTSSVDEQELADLAHAHQLPLVVDLGSGSLIDFASLGLPGEPTAADMIAKGADIITFSGDKLLGGPQCGLIAGTRELIDHIKKNPLKRALRLDKMTLAAVAEVLKLYRDPGSVVQKLPALRQVTREVADIRQQAQRVCEALSGELPPGWKIEVVDCFSQIGSGALPLETIESVACCLSGGELTDVRDIALALRKLPTPILGRVHKGVLWLDLRCLEREQEFIGLMRQLHL